MKYQFLKIVAGLQTIFGVVILLVALFVAAVGSDLTLNLHRSLLASGAPQKTVELMDAVANGAVYGFSFQIFLTGIFIAAFGQLLFVFMDIETNTRKMAELQEEEPQKEEQPVAVAPRPAPKPIYNSVGEVTGYMA